jgi:hypothetical protein
MNHYAKHGIERSCVPILLPLGNFGWEFYAFSYEVDAVESDLVNVLAIGIKRGNRLIISGKEIHI